MCYKGKDRDESWGSFELAESRKRVAVYRNEDTKVAYVCMAGELSATTVSEVALRKGISEKRKERHRRIIPAILEKYKDYEVHLAGHSYGAMKLMQLIVDGYVFPE